MNDRSYLRLLRDPGFAWMLASQFLGALNDNIYRWSITFFALDLARQGQVWEFAGARMTLDPEVLVAAMRETLIPAAALADPRPWKFW